MNATVMIETVNREYADAMVHYNQQVNEQLIAHAKDFYKENLNSKMIQDICAMNLDDKVWLLKQYKEELKTTSKPDLDDLY